MFKLNSSVSKTFIQRNKRFNPRVVEICKVARPPSASFFLAARHRIRSSVECGMLCAGSRVNGCECSVQGGISWFASDD